MSNPSWELAAWLCMESWLLLLLLSSSSSFLFYWLTKVEVAEGKKCKEKRESHLPSTLLSWLQVLLPGRCLQLLPLMWVLSWVLWRLLHSLAAITWGMWCPIHFIASLFLALYIDSEQQSKWYHSSATHSISA